MEKNYQNLHGHVKKSIVIIALLTAILTQYTFSARAAAAVKSYPITSKLNHSYDSKIKRKADNRPDRDYPNSQLTSASAAFRKVVGHQKNYIIVGIIGGGLRVLNPLNFGVLGNASVQNDTPVGKALFVHTQTNPTFGGELGYRFGENGFFIRYSHYKSDDVTTILAGANEKIWSILIPPEFVEDVSTFAQGRFKTNYNFTDFYFSHIFGTFLCGSIGVSQGSLLSRWAVGYRGGRLPADIILPVNWHNLYNGTGLLLGLNFSYKLFHVVNVVGGILGRAFYGNMSSRYFSADTNGTIIEVNSRFKSLVPELSADVGLALNMHFTRPGAHVILSLLYQYNALFNQDAFVWVSQNRTTALTVHRVIQWSGFLAKLSLGFSV